MKIVVQRVRNASVTVEQKCTGAIDQGLLLLVGFTEKDGPPQVKFLAEKVVRLRIFQDEEGKMNRSLLDIKGNILSVSQFTLYGNCRKGRRPSFLAAAKPDAALPLYELFNKQLRSYNVHVETGIFGAHMEISLVNDGPVTLILESEPD